MQVNDASYADSLFSAALTQSSGLENLANAALQRGIDAFTNRGGADGRDVSEEVWV